MSLFGTGRKEGCLAVFILVVLGMVIHAPGLFGGKHRLPVDPGTLPPYQVGAAGSTAPLDTEVGVNQSILLPAMASAGATLRDGELPLWNRDARLGEPFAITGAPILWPPFWLLMLPDGWRWLDLVMFLHTALACGFMYRFLRVTSLSRYVAFLGGAMYGLGWFLTAQMDRLPEAAAVAMLPAALELTYRITLFGRERFGPLLGLALAAMFWTGGSGFAPMGAGVCLALFVARLLVTDRYDHLAAIRTASIGGVLATLLTAPVWLDAIQLAPATLTAYDPHLGAPQAAGLLGLWAPTAFGSLTHAGPTALRTLNPATDPLQLVMYPSSIAIFLMVLGGLRQKRTWAALFWLLIAGGGLLLTLDSPLRHLTWDLLGWQPGVPGAALLLLHLGTTMFACVALENFFEAPIARKFAAPTTAGLALACCVAWVIACLLVPSLGQRTVSALVGEASAAEIGEATRHLTVAFAPAVTSIALIAVLFLLWRPLGMLRFKALLAVAALAEIMLLSSWVPTRTQASPDLTAFAERLPVTEGRLAIVGGGDLPPGGAATAQGTATLHTDGNRILQRTADYLRLVDAGAVDVGTRARVHPLPASSSLVHPLLAAARVDTAVSTGPFSGSEYVPLTASPGDEATPSLRVATRPTPPGPRILYDVVAVESRADAATHMTQSRWRLDETIFVENTDPEFSCKCLGAEAAAVVEAQGANTLDLAVTMGTERGYLLLPQAWAPGWEARVDGETVELLPANLGLSAIALAEGDHQVTLRYRPWSLRFGLPLLGLGLVLGAGLSVLVFVRSRR